MALADGLGDAVEHLGGVAARLALQLRDSADVLEVACCCMRAATRGERVLERDAEPLVGERRARTRPGPARRRRRPRLQCARGSECPARMAEASTWRLSASWSPNARRSRSTRMRITERTTSGTPGTTTAEDRRPAIAEQSYQRARA